jgi:hypothetical protein
VNVRQREQDGEDQERRAEQEVAIATQQTMKDRGPLQCQQPHQRIGVMDRIKTLKNDPAGSTQSKRQDQAILD